MVEEGKKELIRLEEEYTKSQIRAERDFLISQVDWRVRRHQDEVVLGLPATEPLEPLLLYIQALRDVPSQEGFPENVIWPKIPN